MSDLTDETKKQISIAAYFLAKKKHPYDRLCWMLAERQLFIEKKSQNASIEEKKQRAAQIYHSCCDYDVLCWLISEKDLLLKKSGFKQGTNPFF